MTAGPLLYDYKVVEIIRVVDGDTVDARVDLGFHTTAAWRFRLLDCDAPEHREPGWRECTAFTTAWLASSLSALRVRTEKADSFGRWLADFYRGENHLADRINDLMTQNGWSSPDVRTVR